MLGWQLFAAQSFQANCGHTQEVIVLPLPDGATRIVPVLGEGC
jgi:hypothetical protein